MGAHHLPRQGQSQADAWRGAPGAHGPGEEGLEEAGAHLLRNPRPLVSHEDPGPGARPAWGRRALPGEGAHYVHPLPLGGCSDGVAEQVGERTLDEDGIERGGREVALGLQLQWDTGFVRLRLHVFEGPLEDVIQLAAGFKPQGLARLHPRHVEQGRDEANLPLTRAAGQREHPLLLLGQRAGGAIGHEAQRRPEPGQGRSQIMGHRGHEGIFQAAEFPEALAHPLQLRREGLDFVWPLHRVQRGEVALAHPMGLGGQQGQGVGDPPGHPAGHAPGGEQGEASQHPAHHDGGRPNGVGLGLALLHGLVQGVDAGDPRLREALVKDEALLATLGGEQKRTGVALGDLLGIVPVVLRGLKKAWGDGGVVLREQAVEFHEVGPHGARHVAPGGRALLTGEDALPGSDLHLPGCLVEGFLLLEGAELFLPDGGEEGGDSHQRHPREARRAQQDGGQQEMGNEEALGESHSVTDSKGREGLPVGVRQACRIPVSNLEPSASHAQCSRALSQRGCEVGHISPWASLPDRGASWCCAPRRALRGRHADVEPGFRVHFPP
ncbi:hypothetical protein STIAU_7529 [Stigmatella aurantiaca DW4/3-1]|uniref:Uncharacterized protein n=1 Tax=Stigmatella aurantiaca (strain DW4/3-1) TaxID=378806 RepID=Q094U9_STIAD|nr:hypothetical protein STIAU_7529 [Stigmatella aurantiaca DW4/3-1]